jgi:hypothetical protein
VIAASTERKDRLNARASQLALDYAWRKFHLERKYRDSLLWAKNSGKGFWWFNWDKNALANVRTKNPITQTETISPVPIGDVKIEVGSPFEVLVADPGIAALADQPEIMRIKLRDVEEMKARYPEYADFIKPTPGHQEEFHFEKRIASLNARAEGLNISPDDSGSAEDGSGSNKVLVKELFSKPGGTKFPKGRYLVLVGNVLVRQDSELPFFWDYENPYPAEEFVDVPTVGQFYSTTVTEQLIGPQRQYNFIRNKIDQQLRLMMHPKLMIPRQAQIAPSAFHSGAGEKIVYNWLPGLPPPTVWTPPNVAGDAWRMIETLQEEMDDISQIFPSAEGDVGSAKSGFQTNLLQEASDSVHAPDARNHEMTLEGAAWKIRRLMKLGYDTPRLLTVAGRHRQAEVIEFSSEQIDENADIIVQTGSGLPQLKAARMMLLTEWYDKGIFGQVGSPEANRKFLSMADVSGSEDLGDQARKDEDLAQMENDEIASGKAIPVPQFYENHQLHYEIHTDQLKSAEVRDWPDEQRFAFISHVLLHLKFINPIGAAQLAIEYGLNELIGQGMDKIPPPPLPMGAGMQPPPPPQEEVGEVSQEPPPQEAVEAPPLAA